MPVMDEFKEEREKMKDASFKEKARYFWYYYKLHTIGAIFAIIVLFVLIRDVTTQKDAQFFAVVLNSIDQTEESGEQFKNDFLAYTGLDEANGTVMIDSSINITSEPTSELDMAAAQRMMVYTSTGELDVIVGGDDVFPQYAGNELFYDLREILSPEQLMEYGPNFYYIDMAQVREMNDSEEVYSVDYVAPELIDPRHPEEMTDPVPVGLFVTDSKRLTDAYYFLGEDYTAVGIPVTAKHPEIAIAFLDFLFE